MNSIVLGSGSPRRKELLSAIWKGEIEILKSDVEEVFPSDLAAEDVALYLADLKGKDLKTKLGLKDKLLITADTVVVSDNRVLGKPVDKEDAKSMLSSLSGKSHAVITGVMIYTHEKTIPIEESTEVFFNDLSPTDIDFYVENFNPLDKAGSYGIQDYIGMIGIEKIQGCYYNVMGLPTQKLYQVLSDLTARK